MTTYLFERAECKGAHDQPHPMLHAAINFAEVQRAFVEKGMDAFSPGSFEEANELAAMLAGQFVMNIIHAAVLNPAWASAVLGSIAEEDLVVMAANVSEFVNDIFAIDPAYALIKEALGD